MCPTLRNGEVPGNTEVRSQVGSQYFHSEPHSYPCASIFCSLSDNSRGGAGAADPARKSDKTRLTHRPMATTLRLPRINRFVIPCCAVFCGSDGGVNGVRRLAANSRRLRPFITDSPGKTFPRCGVRYEVEDARYDKSAYRRRRLLWTQRSSPVNKA
jgi:hypothetical protein